MTKTRLFGIPFDDGSMEEAVDAALRLIRAGRCARAVTPNPEIVLAARKNPDLTAAVRSADLILPDGIGLVLASRLTESPLRHRLPGIDFASALMERLAAQGGSVYLLGGRPGVADRAAGRLTKQYPGLRIAGSRHGYFSEAEETEILSELSDKKPALILVCLGSPRQELWMARTAPRLAGGLMVGLGGALDVYSGQKQRAPETLRRLGLEWLFRLFREPERLPRMIRLPAVFWAALTERYRRAS